MAASDMRIDRGTMELNQINYFINLAETLNFTAAARLSGVSQPSLTRAIRRLEEELGGPLIYRDGKDSRLTGLGQDVEAEFRRKSSLPIKQIDTSRHIATNKRINDCELIRKIFIQHLRASNARTRAAEMGLGYRIPLVWRHEIHGI